MKKNKLQKIADVRCKWEGIVDDCEPDVDGQGSLGCPECLSIVKISEEVSSE